MGTQSAIGTLKCRPAYSVRGVIESKRKSLRTGQQQSWKNELSWKSEEERRIR